MSRIIDVVNKIMQISGEMNTLRSCSTVRTSCASWDSPKNTAFLRTVPGNAKVFYRGF